MRQAAALLIRQGQRARVLLVLPDGLRHRCPAGLTVDGEDCLPPGRTQARSVRWYHVRPDARGYDNRTYCRTAAARPCLQPIAYRLGEIEALRGRSMFEAAEVPALQRPGTHWLEVWLSRGERLARRFSAAARPASFSLVVRRDDSYVGHLTELLGVPYVFAPTRVRSLGHQTDLRLGVDCVALAVYGQRRLRPDAAPPYLSLAGLLLRTRLLLRAPSLPALLGHRPPAKPGDLIHLNHHVAVLSRDRAPAGLGPEDVVIHALQGVAEEVALARLPTTGRPVRLLRWRVESVP